MKKTTWIAVVAVINLLLLPFVLVSPTPTAAEADGTVFFSCCKESAAGDSYCCNRCCIFTWDCLGPDWCGDR